MSSLTWNTPENTQKQRSPGEYSAPSAITVNDTSAEEIKPAGNASYLTLSNQGPSNIYCRIGGNASTTEFNFIIPPGSNHWGQRTNKQQITAICNTGETATLMVAIAPELEK